MTVDVITPDELGPAELTAWRDFQRADPGLDSPFLAPEFTLAVGRERPGARVAVLSDGTGEVGFFPFERHRLGLGVPIGEGLCDRQGLVHTPGLDWEPRELLRACGLQLWRFDHLAAGQWPFEHGVVHRGESPVLDLREGFDTYLAGYRSRAPQSAKSLDKKRRRLERRLGPVRLEFDDQDPRMLATLMRWKSGQYRDKNQVDLFSRPWVVDLLDELRRTRAPTCTGVLSTLYAADRPIAVHLGLRSERVLHYWFSSFDPEVSAYSPGRMLLMELARAAADEDLDWLELGKGQEDYKQHVKSTALTVTEGWATRDTLPATVRRAQVESANRLRAAVADNPMLRDLALRTLRRFPRMWQGT
ncbi:GNAT family N-acetyltransferase [Streptomyces sp. NA04227]|uniref:GNAT family N-acetyltransferase n=1 Tax=Streptomyces sp. NA04227 TaxID=2742136 RepID=UPI0015919902|nr:GNAT family N-acetyltransferase [Streptomyces sp. NA04227]QKW09740.1 GNAT family N-acetyltransferase [Streptomyces sp. NA04227]